MQPTSSLCRSVHAHSQEKRWDHRTKSHNLAFVLKMRCGKFQQCSTKLIVVFLVLKLCRLQDDEERTFLRNNDIYTALKPKISTSASSSSWTKKSNLTLDNVNCQWQIGNDTLFPLFSRQPTGKYPKMMNIWRKSQRNGIPQVSVEPIFWCF